jgi:phthalate 4,5-dioxygenase
MFPSEENKLVCEIEPGAPMHDVFKRYWMPVAISSDIPEPDSDPHRTTVLGEDYVLFRDSEGTAALMRERCCHRGASLMLGRVEEGGIRCIYHGWKFSADGTILDMPNCQDEKFKTRYRQPAFPVREAGGMVWAYLGPKEHEPPFPHYPFFDVPVSHIYPAVIVYAGNYLQTMEGLLDSSHLGVLHSDALMMEGPNRADVTRMLREEKAPAFECEETEFGLRYAAIRGATGENGERVSIARVTAMQFPSTCYIAPDNIVIFSIPINNETTMFYDVIWQWDEPFTREELQARLVAGGIDEAGMRWGLGREYFGKPGTACRENNWLQDREAMRAGKTFSGIINFVPEDGAVIASAGAIYDRTHENLVPADIAIARARRVLLANMRAIQDGEPARGINPEPPARPAMGPVTPDRPWQQIPYHMGRNRALEEV